MDSTTNQTKEQTMNTATAKQIDYINRLKAERLVLAYDPEAREENERNAAEQPKAFAAGVVLRIARNLWEEGKFDREAAGIVIEQLQLAPRCESFPATEQAETPEGMHKFGGVFFKVQRAVHGSGKLYAKALVEDGQGGWEFEYVAGAIRNLSTETVLSAEEAAQFGHLYGICCNCAATLTDEVSIHFGYGPTCAKRNGWPHGKRAMKEAVAS